MRSMERRINMAIDTRDQIEILYSELLEEIESSIELRNRAFDLKEYAQALQFGTVAASYAIIASKLEPIIIQNNGG